MHQKRWIRRLCLFWKVFHNKVAKYILVPSIRTSARQPNTFTSFYYRSEYFQNTFLPCVIQESNKLDPHKRRCLSKDGVSYNNSRKALLNFVKPSENIIYNIHDQFGIKLFTRLRLGFSHLREHNLRHNTEDTLNRFCSCSTAAGTMLPCFLRYQFFNDIWKIFMTDLININRSLSSLS